jgi:hypothetical protein
MATTDVLDHLTAILGGYSASETAIATKQTRDVAVTEGDVIDAFILELAVLPVTELALLARRAALRKSPHAPSRAAARVLAALGPDGPGTGPCPYCSGR